MVLHININSSFKNSLKVLITLSLALSVLSNGYVPVIGVIANPEPEDAQNPDRSKIMTNYIRWLEASGAKTIAIPPWTSDSELDEILLKVNGLLWQGGNRNLILDGPYEQFSARLLNKAFSLKKNKNITVPIWVTCLGMQLVHVLIANDLSVLSKFDANNVATPLIFDVNEIKSSKMFSLFDEEDISNLRLKNTTSQFHHFGINKRDFYRFPNLNKVLKITSYGQGMESYENLSIQSVEGINYPIYGTQFHAEKIPYDYFEGHDIPQTAEAIKISSNLGLFFVNEARKNNNVFSKEDKKKFIFINSFEDKSIDDAQGHRFYYYDEISKQNKTNEF